MPFAAAIGLRALDHLENDGPQLYAAMNRRARSLADAIRMTLRELQLGYTVVQLESIVDFKFRAGGPTRSYDDQQRGDQRAYAAFYHAMRARGVLLPPSHNEVMFLSTAHGDDDVAVTAAAIAESLHELRAHGIV
jgi:glutamate-1-semialdehyde 2,1-aminomutase